MKTSYHTTQMQSTRKPQTHPSNSASKPHNRLILPTKKIDWSSEPPNPSDFASRSTLARMYPATTLLLAGVQRLCAPLLKILLRLRASQPALWLSTHRDHSNPSSQAHPPQEPRSESPRYTYPSTSKDLLLQDCSVPLAVVCRMLQHISSSSLPFPNGGLRASDAEIFPANAEASRSAGDQSPTKPTNE